MKSQTLSYNLPLRLAAAAFLVFAASLVFAQTPVDNEGNPVGTVYGEYGGDDPGDEALVDTLSAAELETLVGPIALYPDDLLAIVLPASTYPLEIVQAARFLVDLESDSSLTPDDDWDDSVVALLNYPEVVRMMNDDIDWTWRLGEAVVAQQSDVVAAVESFRDRAYAAGNLNSDEHQKVTRTESAIEIDPIEDDVIYVPYYEPEVVVVRQARPAYYYYPRAYPVYYYPYPAGYHFSSGFFWGVTTAYQIGWSNRYLGVQHYSYLGHPYFGWNYYDNYYWRRPSIQVFHNYYGRRSHSESGYRNQHGDHWRPRYRGGARPGHYESRSRYYADQRRSSSDSGYARRDRRDGSSVAQRRNNAQTARQDASTRQAARPNTATERRTGNASRSRSDANGDAIRFRERNRGSVQSTPGGRARTAGRTDTLAAGTARARTAGTGITGPGSANRRTSNQRADPAAGTVGRTGSTRPAARVEQRRRTEPSTERRSAPAAATGNVPARIRSDNNRRNATQSTTRQEARSNPPARARTQYSAPARPPVRASRPADTQLNAPSRTPVRTEPPRRSSPPAAAPNRSAPQPDRRTSDKPARSRTQNDRSNRRRDRN